MAIIRANRNAIFTRLFGGSIAFAREKVAAVLITCHISPNLLTFFGLLASLAAAIFLAWGGGDAIGTDEGNSFHPILAAMMIILSSAFDILDGAVARNNKHITQLGGFLDSSFDRIADAAIFTGLLIYYLNHPETSHAKLLAVLSMVALANAEIISYLKARAENFIESCPVGYWQRGERIAAILIGLFSSHIETVIVMLAILPALTVLRRLIFAARQIARKDKNIPLLDPKAPLQGIMKLALWRYRRGTLPYDLVTAFNICIILFVDIDLL
jgi:phosphatidylglycerophosphate synthase